MLVAKVGRVIAKSPNGDTQFDHYLVAPVRWIPLPGFSLADVQDEGGCSLPPPLSRIADVCLLRFLALLMSVSCLLCVHLPAISLRLSMSRSEAKCCVRYSFHASLAVRPVVPGP
jgi:hypothetical protein